MSEILGEARILIRPDTLAFRTQLQEQLLAAQRTVKPVIVPVRFVGAGGGAGGTAKEVEEQQALAGAQKVTAQTTRAEAAAVALSARRHEQLGRGIGANILQMLGLRGATLAASSAFIGGAAATIVVAKSIGAASSRTEELNKSVEVFVGSAAGIKQWAATAANSMGISETAALSASATFGQLFRTLGVGPGQAAALSETLVQLASDLASFNNVSTDRALKALQSGLVGQARPLRELGIFLTEARVKQEALAESGKKTATELDQQDKILARYNLILQDSSLAQGDFARTSGQAANQSRILKANISDLAATIGGPFLSVAKKAEQATNELFQNFGRQQQQARSPFGGGGLQFGSSLQPQIDKALELQNVLSKAQEKINSFRADLDKVGGPKSITGLNEFVVKLEQFRDELAPLGESGANAAARINALVEQIQRTGTIPPIDLSNLFFVNEQAAKTKAELLKKAFLIPFTSPDIANAGKNFFNLFLSGVAQAAKPRQGFGAGQTFETSTTTRIAIAEAKNSPEVKSLIQKRVGEIDRTLAQLEKDAQGPKVQAAEQRLANERKGLVGQLESMAQAEASATQAAADKAQSARDKRDQALLSFVGGDRQTRLENNLLIAQGTQGALNDINAEKALIKFFNDSLARIKRLQSAGLISAKAAHDAIETVIRERIQANNDLKALNATQAQDAAAAKQQATQDRQSHLEALLSIAETTPGTRDDVKRLNAIIDFDNKRIKALQAKGKKTREEKAELDALRVDLAQRRQALRNLVGEQKKNLTAQAEFNFLQTQTGFVSNLLGNLIPGGATGGLVGGGGPSVPSNVRPTGQLSAAQTTSQANLVRGVSSGQAETQTFWLKQIAKILKDMNQGDAHPEAHKQRRTGAAVMDFQSATPGF